MENNFKIEIISPEKIIFSDEAKMVTLPSYEGDMSILKNHISIITFLRPGIVKVEKKDNKVDLIISMKNVNLVVLLKPNFSSITNVL